MRSLKLLAAALLLLPLAVVVSQPNENGLLQNGQPNTHVIPLANYTELMAKYPEFLAPAQRESFKKLPFYGALFPWSPVWFPGTDVINKYVDDANDIAERLPRESSDIDKVIDLMKRIIKDKSEMAHWMSLEKGVDQEKYQRFDYLNHVFDLMFGTLAQTMNFLADYHQKGMANAPNGTTPAPESSSTLPDVDYSNDEPNGDPPIDYGDYEQFPQERANKETEEPLEEKYIKIAFVIGSFIYTLVFLVWVFYQSWKMYFGNYRVADAENGRRRRRRRNIGLSNEIAGEDIEMVQV